jgi:dihydroorotate dehydrogenase
MGLAFPGPVGLAAGYDRDGSLVSRFRTWGFGFVELGTVTPQPQEGHNPGVIALTDCIRGSRIMYLPTAARGVIGISIAARPGASASQAQDDYGFCIAAAADAADYIVVNLTARDMARQPGADARRAELLSALGRARAALGGLRPPLLIKLPCSSAQDRAVHELASGYDGWVAMLDETNAARTLAALAAMPATPPLIAVGGIASVRDALEARGAGAVLVQIHRAFAQQGSALVRAIGAAWPRSAAGEPQARQAYSSRQIA